MIGAARQFLSHTYGGLPAVTWLICLAAFVNRAGSMVLPFLGIYLGRRFGLTVEQSGYILSLYGVGSTIGNLIGGKLADVLGPIRVQLLTLTMAAMWMGAMTQFASVATIAAGTFVLGLLNDAFRPGNMAAVLASVPPHLGPTALTLNRVMVNAGWAIGPTIGGMLALIDYQWLFVVDGATCALAAIVLFAFVPTALGSRSAAAHTASTETRADAARSTTSAWSDGKFLLLLLANIVTLLSFMQYFSTETRWLKNEFGATEDMIGYVLAINPVLIVLFEMPLVRALAGRPRLPIVAFGTLLIGVAFPILTISSLGMNGVVMQMLLLTIGEMFSFSPLGGFVGDRAAPGRRGQYLGMHGAAFSFAFMIAPSLGGAIYDRAGPDSLWWTCFSLALIAAVGYLALHRADPPRPRTDAN
jgi:predicted MFS family arabinose efflux permease